MGSGKVTAPGGGTATGVWFGNLAWPGNRSCGDFARDVFRISGAKTDKEKALAFYDWFTRCMMRGNNLMMPDGAGGYSRCYDPLILLTSWGSGECTFWGWVATECLNAAGLKARRVVVHNNGHTYYEVWYKGDDGIEQWHAFDPFIGWYFLNENGEVASCEQLAANPQLAQNPLPGHPVPLGHHPERGHMAHRHRTEDQVFIEQPLRFEENQWDLQKGMDVTFNFMPEAPDKALLVGRRGDESPPAEAACCDIAEISRLGFRQHSKHIPYWKNYMWPTVNRTRLNEGRPVRFHGAGALRWKPLFQGEEVTCETHNAVFENGCVRPKDRHDFAEVWYHFKLPFLASYIIVDYDVAGGGGDYWGLALSADDRRTMWPLRTKSNSPHYGVASNGQAQWRAGESSVQGLREFWLRIDMFSHAPEPKLAVQAMNITVGFEHNMYVQPRLVPGENALWLEAKELSPDVSLEAEWIYQVQGEERRFLLALEKAGRAEEALSLDVSSPAGILMTGLKLSAR